LWTYAAKSQVDSSPVLAGDRVYVGSDDGSLLVLRLEDGEELEKFEAGGANTASPAIVSEALVIGTEDGDVYCLGSRAPKGD
jgi:outer membrane protein assembly factor BamB